jgi:RNA polymerase sigma-70 factor (ECF subfamily)
MTDIGTGAGTGLEAATVAFEDHRPYLLAVAYRVLGRVGEAEDVVQEAWMRWREVDHGTVENDRAYLTRVTTRLAVDRLRLEKRRRETYVGPWLPEPLALEPDVAEQVELAGSVEMALLVVLETLSPLERAVFVLREAFGEPYEEIARAVDRSEDAVRQLAHRARRHVDERRPRFDADRRTRREVTERFLDAAAGGDVEELLELLAPDVTLVSDGGGVVRAALRPLEGADAVARWLAGVATRPLEQPSMEVVDLNGGPAAIVRSSGKAQAAIVLGIAGGRIRAIYLVANPEKLIRLDR